MHSKSLSFDDVTFGFKNRNPLFKNLSCQFETGDRAGKIIGIMGPSGVGKSTFCDLAIGIQSPSHGSVKLEPSRANVAVIPQKAVIFDDLSIIENISCLRHSTTIGRTFNVNSVPVAMKSMGLETIAASNSLPSSLSGGECQRVMLARIQTIDCDVLILDEPCSFLDNRVKETFLNALRSAVLNRGLLAFMVSHLWDEVRYAADEVVFFNKGTAESVTLHSASVESAIELPPTVDSLFSVHWPDCVLFDKPSLDLLFDRASFGSAHYLGLYGNNAANLRQFSSSFIAAPHDARPREMLRKAIQCALSTDSKKSILYDADGVKIDVDA